MRGGLLQVRAYASPAGMSEPPPGSHRDENRRGIMGREPGVKGALGRLATPVGSKDSKLPGPWGVLLKPEVIGKSGIELIR